MSCWKMRPVSSALLAMVKAAASAKNVTARALIFVTAAPVKRTAIIAIRASFLVTSATGLVVWIHHLPSTGVNLYMTLTPWLRSLAESHCRLLATLLNLVRRYE